MATSLIPYDDSGKAVLDYGEAGTRPSIGGPKIWAIAVILVFFGGFAAWSAWFPLSSAAIAPGVVSPEGDRRTVQHLEGGIISRIHVQEGARIEAGDLLISLDAAQARAAYDIQESRYVTMTATQARLETERRLIVDPSLADSLAPEGGEPRIPYPSELAENMPAAELAALLRNQSDLFESRRAVLVGKEAVANKEIAQLNEKIRGLNDEIESIRKEDALVEDQLDGLMRLHAKGHAPKTRVIELQRQNVRLDGSVGERRAEIAEARVQIAKAQRAIITDREAYLNDVNNQLTSVQANLADIEARMGAAADRLNRVEIRAPHAGVVMDLRFTADQGVIRQGEPILDIVPEDAQLLVDARVAPSDIDNVALGQRARIVLPAYGRRAQGMIYGEVVYLAADRLIDETTGAPYFPARIKVDQSTLVQEDAVIALRPGLAAEIFILTGERTAFDYIADPFLQSLDRSFKEI